jgi:vacuolar protein sorting-associated protein 13A/C
MQINGLGVYLDELSPFPKRKSSPEEEPLHSYILSPLSFNSKLRQADTASCVAIPKYLVLSELHHMSIFLSKSQLELGNKIVLAMSARENAARPLFPEYRPLTGVNKDSAKEWWIYAFRCIGRLNGRRLWPEFLDTFRKRKTYITLYKRSAYSESCQWLTPLSEAENARLDKIAENREISIEGIMAWRNIADAQVELEKTKRDDAEKKKKATGGIMAALSGGIMAALFGSKERAYSDESSGDDDPPITLSTELESIAMKQTEGAELSKDSKLCDIEFILGVFKINLVGHAMKNLASF